MKITMSYDTDSKDCQVAIDGKSVDNLTSLSIGKYTDEGYDCCVCSTTKDDSGVMNSQSWTSYASKEEELKGQIKTHILGK